MQSIDTVIFDLGGVLIDWNPRHLYRKIFEKEEQMEWFLQNVCTSDWNEQQDAGRSFEDGTNELLKKFPEHEAPIRAWYDRWQETMNGPIAGTVEILKQIRESKKHKLYALTNWSEQTFPWALKNFDFLHWFEGVVVSGHEKTRKPFPEFYQILIDRYKIEPSKTIFIDDVLRNVSGAQAVGIAGVLFRSPQQLKSELQKLGVVEINHLNH